MFRVNGHVVRDYGILKQTIHRAWIEQRRDADVVMHGRGRPQDWARWFGNTPCNEEGHPGRFEADAGLPMPLRPKYDAPEDPVADEQLQNWFTVQSVRVRDRLCGWNLYVVTPDSFGWARSSRAFLHGAPHIKTRELRGRLPMCWEEPPELQPVPQLGVCTDCSGEGCGRCLPYLNWAGRVDGYRGRYVDYDGGDGFWWRERREGDGWSCYRPDREPREVRKIDDELANRPDDLRLETRAHRWEYLVEAAGDEDHPYRESDCHLDMWHVMINWWTGNVNKPPDTLPRAFLRGPYA